MRLAVSLSGIGILRGEFGRDERTLPWLAIGWNWKLHLHRLPEDSVAEDKLAFIEARGCGLDIRIHEAVPPFRHFRSVRVPQQNRRAIAGDAIMYGAQELLGAEENDA